MCVGDWRLGRLIRTQFTRVSLAGFALTNIQANPQRVGIFIGDVTTTAAASTPSALDFGGTTMFSFCGESGPLLITMATHGDLSTRAFSVRAGSIGLACTFAEFILPEEVIAQALEDVMGNYAKKIKGM